MKTTVFQIWIESGIIRSMDPDSKSGSEVWIRKQEGKNYPQKLKKLRFHVLKCWMFSVEG
jgi:hypothetical protein